ncbi:hypothetical protein V6N12_069494 [Hibiscus sabdariffa]|uniref:Reverse transcriptase domain-containing protein n=1 Tax=Hibiscus sabdariffa TaxID=183260 RepID=A0ABR2FE72_9ROSI
MAFCAELCLKVCKVEADSLAKSVFYNPSGWPRTILWLQSRSSGGLIELSHLQFADELLIFSGGSEGQFRNVKKVLRVFELASGLQLNLKKSMVFGINVPLVGTFPTESLVPSAKFLSIDGRLILIKSILSSLPV